ncbi:sugar phosphate isomerase/epimerase [Candidatus Pelagibacter ubique]|nr:sugar phosphate isomerase/epimerase [Candidatus Pelagibacter ubique]
MFFVSTTFEKDNLPIKSAIDKLYQNSIFNIELGSNHSYEKSYSYLRKYKVNFCVHNYFPIPKKNIVLNIASQNKQIRNRSVKHIKKAIKFSKTIEARLYTFHPGFLTDPDGSNISNKNYDFLWNKKKLISSNYAKSWKLMVKSIKEIIKYSKREKVKIAIESEGSVNSKNHLLMQRPIEYKKFFRIFDKRDIGINLNIGHLNLASIAFKFDKIKFINNISKNIVAMELSHNNGKNDDHLPIRNNTWYWKLINDKKFKNIPKILEFRNIDINKVKKTFLLVNKKSPATKLGFF